MRVLALAVALLATPAFAQADHEVDALETLMVTPVLDEVVAPDVDADLIGAWTLEEVAEAGVLGDMGVDVEEMRCAFTPQGTATVEMGMVQDQDPLRMQRTFDYDTQNGLIVVEDDEPVAYEILADGRLQMTTPQGLVVRLVRTRS